MKILLDAMGGDNAPQSAVMGAILAVRAFGVCVALVGRRADISDCVTKAGYKALPSGIEIIDTPDVVTMEDNPASAIKDKPKASMTVGLTMLHDGGGDAFVSAGNTGALLTGATLLAKRIRGVRRAALAPVLPSRNGGVLVIDCGANAVTTAEYLHQFAYMGSYYARHVMKRENPRVGLLNIGAEPGKGTDLQKETYARLTASKEKGRLNFIGNIEGRDVMLGGVDVVVTDGFTGNVLLKCIEGTAFFVMSELKGVFKQSVRTKLAAGFMKLALLKFKKRFSPSEFGGTPLLGISKPVIKAHGNSDANAFFNAIRQARDAVQSGMIGELEANIAEIAEETRRYIQLGQSMTELEQRLDYNFHDKSILETALTHSSYANEFSGKRPAYNERLEFLGDSILGMTVSRYLYTNYPGMSEGKMTKLRAEVVCEKSLVKVAESLKLGEHLHLGRGEALSGGRSRPSILADAVEAVFAAVLLDGGQEAAERAVLKMLQAKIEERTQKKTDKDFKTALQELTQRKSQQSLSYHVLSATGPEHQKNFTAEVRLNDKPIGQGEGRTKKEAEQVAAERALRAIEN